ncbi:MAG: hypothetical protein II581_05560 [Oscillospiraceae bacterium]|nr:hypothetical protein [Oscillospiraceae bacterium]
MKTFEAPKMEVIKLDPKDVISASGNDSDETEAPTTTAKVPGIDFGHGAIGNGNAC